MDKDIESAPCLETKNYREEYPDFDLSLCRYGFSNGKYQLYYTGFSGQVIPRYVEEKEFLKQLYDSDRKKNVVPKNFYKIPRIIHQIWLGSSLPERYKKLTETWKSLTDWEYRLWTENEIQSLSLYNEDLYQASEHYGERSDILRYEILRRFGGVYADVDVECLHPEFFEFAHKMYGFYAGLESMEWNMPLCLGSALLASSPHHPLMEKLVISLKEHIEKLEKMENPSFLGSYDFPVSDKFKAVMTTGPRYMTEVVLGNKDLLSTDGIVLPPTFFYPIVPREIPHRDIYFFQETAAVHYWFMDWNTDSGKVKNS